MKVDWCDIKIMKKKKKKPGQNGAIIKSGVEILYFLF